LRIALVSAATLLLTANAFAQAPAPAEKAAFELHLAGKPIGKASYALSNDKHGVKLTSRYTFRLGGVSGDFSDDFKLEPDYSFQEGTIVNEDNQRRTSLLPNKPRTEIAVGSFLGGAEPTTFVPIKPNLLVLAPFDAGAAEAILLHATTHPSPDNKYSVFLVGNGGPSGGGGGGRGRGAAEQTSPDQAAASLPATNTAYDAVWVKGRDVTGTLDGKPVELHSYLLGFGSVRCIFFADNANNLMQLNLVPMQAVYLHTGFKLDPILPTTPAVPSR
jgi:hypothetical protein